MTPPTVGEPNKGPTNTMFHQPEQQLASSTGEPPTLARLDSTNCGSSALLPSDEPSTLSPDQKSGTLETPVSSKLIPQEADSGYEASPSSVNDSCSFSFDDNGQERRADPAAVSRVGTKTDSTSSSCPESEESKDFEESSSAILMEFSGSMPQTSDHCERHCDCEDYVDGPPSCRSCRNSGRHLCASRNCRDNPDCDADDPRHLGRDDRPSSLPIPIPVNVVDESGRSRPAGLRGQRMQRLHSRSLPTAVEIPMLPSPSPTSLSAFHPLSWPTFRPFVTWWLRPAVDVATPDLPSRPSRGEKSRRRLIDSDASSDLSSSESDGPEEVFVEDGNQLVIFCDEANMEEESPVISSAPTANGHLFVVTDGPPSPTCSPSFTSNNVRRSRSISVNLPLERDLQQACQVVGQTLRRLSDQFNSQLSQRRQSVRNRRYTVGDIARFSVVTNHNRRNDSDGDANSQTVRPDDGQGQGTS